MAEEQSSNKGRGTDLLLATAAIMDGAWKNTSSDEKRRKDDRIVVGETVAMAHSGFSLDASRRVDVDSAFDVCR